MIKHKRISRSIAAAIVILALAVTATACTPSTEPTTSTAPVAVRIAALRGPTGIGLVKLMRDQDAGDTANDYTFYLTGTPDDIVAQISSGQADIAALPTNMAAILYQKTSQNIQLLAINTLGVLYVLEKGDTIQTFADLAGRELLASGQGATPEYAINELLAQTGLTDSVKVTYKTEHAELATLAAAGQADLVLLPEPFVTTVLSKNPDLRIALDLTEVWQTVHAGKNESELAMGCLIVNKAFAQQNPAAIKSFLQEYQQSVDAVNSDPDTAGAWVAEYQIMADAKLAASAIPNCHIVLIEGAAMQPMLEPFYQVLYAANPQSIGGKLPDAAFYYTGE
jgi:NitT/TauT family transport system substrate-binding protein